MPYKLWLIGGLKSSLINLSVDLSVISYLYIYIIYIVNPNPNSLNSEPGFVSLRWARIYPPIWDHSPNLGYRISCQLARQPSGLGCPHAVEIKSPAIGLATLCF